MCPCKAFDTGNVRKAYTQIIAASYEREELDRMFAIVKAAMLPYGKRSV